MKFYLKSLSTTFTAFLLIMTVGCSIALGQSAKRFIQLNQIGFYPDGPKQAAVEKNGEGEFYLVTQDTDERVFSGSLSKTRTSQYGDKVVRIADFSSFSKPGAYQLFVPGVGYSHLFHIQQNVYQTVADAGLKAYYYQRASTSLPEKYAGKWHRKAGHPDDSVLVHSSAATAQRPEGTVISSAKGWYDAGDYNKYIVNSGISMGTLLSLYEDFPAYAREIDTNIPEQNNGLPDLLDEVLWNLRWMMTMQDPNDGGVYHKLTSPGFSGMVMPAEDDDARYVVQKSTTAALDFAAVMAQAARVFRDYNEQLPGLADSCLVAAKRAWEWAQDHPQKVYNQRRLNDQYDPDITTGAYGDSHLQDEFFWAAMELYVNTKDEKYYESVELFPEQQMPLPSWGQVRSLGYYTLLRFQDQLTTKAKKDIPKVKQMVLDFADQLVQGRKQMAYRTVMGYEPDHFIWGSNSVAANQGIALIMAYKLMPDDKYLKAALSNIDYLFGRNATGFSFVTGHGNKTPMHPHHRPSVADGISRPVPGLLVGGPNPDQQDGCAYPSDLPDESYSDTKCSYASNEITINWNAPLVYLAHAVEALQSEVSYTGK